MQSPVRAYGFLLLAISITSSQGLGCAVVAPSHRCAPGCQHFDSPEPLNQPILSDHPALVSPDAVEKQQPTPATKNSNELNSARQTTPNWSAEITFSGPIAAEFDQTMPPQPLALESVYRSNDSAAGDIDCHAWPTDPISSGCATAMEVGHPPRHLLHHPNGLISRLLASPGSVENAPPQADVTPAPLPPRPKFHPVPTHPVFRPQAAESLPRPIKQPFYFAPISKDANDPGTEAKSR